MDILVTTPKIEVENGEERNDDLESLERKGFGI